MIAKILSKIDHHCGNHSTHISYSIYALEFHVLLNVYLTYFATFSHTFRKNSYKLHRRRRNDNNEFLFFFLNKDL